MFSENNQISGRQVFRLLTYDFLGMGTLLLPTMLADTAGRDGIFCILAGILTTFLYLKLLRYLLKGMKTSYPDFLKQKCGKICGYVLWGGYFLYFILMASYTAYLFSTLMLSGLVENISFYLVLLLILLLAFYGMAGGIEGRARVYEMLFWFLMIPLFLMLFAACREVKPAYWSPVFVADGKEMLNGSYYVFFCYSMVSIVLFLKEYVSDDKNISARRKKRSVFRWRICSVISDPAWAVRRGRTGSDEISGGHDDEPRAGDGRIFEEDGCFYVQHLVFYAVCDAKQHGFLQWKSG